MHEGRGAQYLLCHDARLPRRPAAKLFTDVAFYTLSQQAAPHSLVWRPVEHGGTQGWHSQFTGHVDPTYNHHTRSVAIFTDPILSHV